MAVAKLRRIGFSVALGSCLALGCGGEKSDEPAPAGSASPAAELPAPVENRATLPNFATLPTIELPGDFPLDVPRYPGARAVKASADTENASNWVAQFTTPDAPEKVYASLSDVFAAEGWATERAEGSDGVILYASKGDRNVTYALQTVRGETAVSLIIVKQP